MRGSGLGTMVLLLAAVSLPAQDAPAPPAQPLPFSHKTHAGTLQQKCKLCHANSDPGETMGIAPASACMQCHSAIRTESPAIQKLARFAKENQPIPWVRVYEVPAFVSFRHRPHLDAGDTCDECHGPVAEREKLWREGSITMGSCMSCHAAKQVSTGCTFCHSRR